MPVANIAAICQYCGSRQPDVDLEEYEACIQMQAEQDIAAEIKGKAPRRVVALGALAICLIFTCLVVFVQSQLLTR